MRGLEVTRTISTFSMAFASSLLTVPTVRALSGLTSLSHLPLRRKCVRRRPRSRPAGHRTACAKSDMPDVEEGRRLFSNVEENGCGGLERARASDFGCAALIAGTMVGAGVLALPIVTKPAGFLPSSAALLGVWAYMAGTALLITELSLSAVCSLGRPSGVSILSLGRITLGPVGGAATAVVYTFLHYAILTAYTAQGGAVLGELYTQLLHAPALPAVAPASLFALGIGGSLLVLPDPAVEALNNVLVGGVALSFVGVMASLAGGFDPSVLFSDSDVSAIPRAIPVMLVANVYHNIVGPVASRLEGDPFRIRRAILLGSAAPLGLFLAYNAAVLGSGVDPSSISAGPVQAFSLLAIATSFVGFVAGLVDLWADVRVSILREQPDAVQRQLWPSYAATVLPPVAFAAADPGIFLRALDFAGTYGIAVLFGFMPAAMAWRNREEVGGFPEMVPGGKPVLALMMAFPALVIAQKVFGH